LAEVWAQTKKDVRRFLDGLSGSLEDR